MSSEIQLAEEFTNPRAGILTVTRNELHFSGGMLDDTMVYSIKAFLMMHRLEIEHDPPYLYWYSTNGFKFIISPGGSAKECIIDSDGMVVTQS